MQRIVNKHHSYTGENLCECGKCRYCIALAKYLDEKSFLNYSVKNTTVKLWFGNVNRKTMKISSDQGLSRLQTNVNNAKRELRNAKDELLRA